MCVDSRKSHHLQVTATRQPTFVRKDCDDERIKKHTAAPQRLGWFLDGIWFGWERPDARVVATIVACGLESFSRTKASPKCQDHAGTVLIGWIDFDVVV